jgi:Mg2+ and Co2+ transporter CorA
LKKKQAKSALFNSIRLIHIFCLPLEINQTSDKTIKSFPPLDGKEETERKKEKDAVGFSNVSIIVAETLLIIRNRNKELSSRCKNRQLHPSQRTKKSCWQK